MTHTSCILTTRMARDPVRLRSAPMQEDLESWDVDGLETVDFLSCVRVERAEADARELGRWRVSLCARHLADARVFKLWRWVSGPTAYARDHRKSLCELLHT